MYQCITHVSHSDRAVRVIASNVIDVDDVEWYSLSHVYTLAESSFLDKTGRMLISIYLTLPQLDQSASAQFLTVFVF